MKIVHIKERAGVFAENKDIASSIREEVVLPTLRNNQEVAFDFNGVEGATQSFVHAMISQAIREYGPEVLGHLIFKNCNDSIKGIIEIVADYMQASE
ncbi:MAG: STAS-like domain-containing protein [Candidatus Saccharimonadales bacterium]